MAAAPKGDRRPGCMRCRSLTRFLAQRPSGPFGNMFTDGSLLQATAGTCAACHRSKTLAAGSRLGEHGALCSSKDAMLSPHMSSSCSRCAVDAIGSTFSFTSQLIRHVATFCRGVCVQWSLHPCQTRSASDALPRCRKYLLPYAFASLLQT